MGDSDANHKQRAAYRDALREYAQFRAEHVSGVEEYLERGEFNTPTTLTESEQTLLREMDEAVGFEPKRCYYNAQVSALEWDEVKYVEGFVITGATGIPIQHAWLEFVETGHLAEVTLADHLRSPDVDVYYGASFETEDIAAQHVNLGKASPIAES